MAVSAWQGFISFGSRMAVSAWLGFISFGSRTALSTWQILLVGVAVGCVCLAWFY